MINIQKYTTYNTDIHNTNHFRGTFSIGEDMNNPVFGKELNHDYLLTVSEDKKNGMVVAQLHFYNKVRLMTLENNKVSYPSFCSISSFELKCVSAAFSLCANGEGDTILTLANGYFGEITTLDNGDEYLILLAVPIVAISIDEFTNIIEMVLANT